MNGQLEGWLRNEGERSQELAGRARRINLLTIQRAVEALNLGRLCRSPHTVGPFIEQELHSPTCRADAAWPIGLRECLPCKN